MAIEVRCQCGWEGNLISSVLAIIWASLEGPCMLLGRFSGGAVLRPHPFQIIILNSWRIRIIPQMLFLIPRTWKLPDTTLSMMRTMMNDGSGKLHRQRSNRRATWAGNYWQGLFLEVPHHSLRYRGLLTLRGIPKKGINLTTQFTQKS